MEYLSEAVSAVLLLTGFVSAEVRDWGLPNSSAIGKINDDIKGSGAALLEETIHEDPPKRDWRFPSLSSLLNKDSVE